MVAKRAAFSAGPWVQNRAGDKLHSQLLHSTCCWRTNVLSLKVIMLVLMLQKRLGFGQPQDDEYGGFIRQKDQVVFRLLLQRRQVTEEDGQSLLLSLPNFLTPSTGRFPDYA